MGDSSIPAGLIASTLGAVAELIMGQSPPGTTVHDWHGNTTTAGGLPFVQGNAEFSNRTPQPVKWCGSPLKVARKGDVLISVRAPVGELNIVDQDLAIGRGLAAIRFEKKDASFGWHQ